MQSITVGGEHFDGPDVVAGWNLFKKLKKFAKKAYKVAKKFSPIHRLGIHKLLKKYGRKALKYAAPALGVASIAMPWLAPAAIAAKLAQRVMRAARKGKKAARFAMRMFGRDAGRRGRRGRYSRGIMRMMQRMRRPSFRRRTWRRRARGWARRFNPRMVRQMAYLARRGNMRAAGVMVDLAGNAEAGDTDCQHLLHQAAGTEHWNDGQHANVVHAAPVAPDAVAGRLDVLGLQPSSVTAGYDRVIIDGATVPVIDDPNADGYWNVVAGLDRPPGGTVQVVAGLDRPPGGTVQVVAGEHAPTYDVVAGRWLSGPPGSTTQVVAGGPLWDALKPQMPYRPDNAPEFWGARDAYKDGITAIPPGRY